MLNNIKLLEEPYSIPTTRIIDPITKQVINEGETETIIEPVVETDEPKEIASGSVRISTFTLYDVCEETRLKLISMPVKLLVFQTEAAPTTGNLHYQGYWEFEKPYPFKALKAKFPKIKLILRAKHATALHNYNYCTKEESKVDGPWMKGNWKDIIVPKPKVNSKGKRLDLNIEPFISDIKAGMKVKELSLKYPNMFMKYNKAFYEYYEMNKPIIGPKINIELFDWQKTLLKIFESEPVHRQILWIWSKESETGKTIFKQYCQQTMNILDINNFVFRDIVHNYNDERIIWINLPRGEVLDTTKINVLERLSDGGYAQSTKYQGSKKYISSHIVVTTNDEPPYDLLPKRIKSICVDFCKPKSLKK